MNTHVHSSTIHNRQQVETTQISTNWQTDKQIVVYTYNGTLFSHKKEWSTDTCYNMDEPQKHYANVLQARQKDYVLYYSIYMKYLQSVNP